MNTTITKVDSYCVFGNPIEHSKSPDIHRAFASQTAQSLEYTRKLVEPDDFTIQATRFFEDGGTGANVTVPFKQDAFDFADRLTDRARIAGAVNTLAKLEDGQIIGDNTDGIGLVRDITQRLKWAIEGKRILILGAGGAVRGVLLPLLQEKPELVAIANRTKSKAEELSVIFSEYGNLQGYSYNTLPNEPFDIIINGTSAGFSGDVPPVHFGCFTSETVVYDMMYSDEPTEFLRFAIDMGVTQWSDGVGMLVGQAAESFRLWRGVEPKTQPVIDQLSEPA
ncbi:shikimate dehydrogenase [Teredinibacter purpureus]|uniref:shikimate dehydrogenase n=1 Tax=Teredinibacter purpureus TaxID=2731756 RepID=UPI000AFEB965|nr:shikimate dehydrogenase [Teredinibacter purpureus]